MAISKVAGSAAARATRVNKAEVAVTKALQGKLVGLRANLMGELTGPKPKAKGADFLNPVTGEKLRSVDLSLGADPVSQQHALVGKDGTTWFVSQTAQGGAWGAGSKKPALITEFSGPVKLPEPRQQALSVPGRRREVLRSPPASERWPAADRRAVVHPRARGSTGRRGCGGPSASRFAAALRVRSTHPTFLVESLVSSSLASVPAWCFVPPQPTP